MNINSDRNMHAQIVLFFYLLIVTLSLKVFANDDELNNGVFEAAFQGKNLSNFSLIYIIIFHKLSKNKHRNLCALPYAEKAEILYFTFYLYALRRVKA